MKRTVALIFGGEGVEHQISEASARNIASLIDTDTYDLLLVGITRCGEWYIYNGTRDKIENGAWQKDKKHLVKTYPVKLGGESGFLSDGKIIPVCCAIPCLHGNFGEDGIIQGALTAAHINYVGQDIYASASTSDKSYTKLAAEYLRIPTARYIVSTAQNPKIARTDAEKKLKYPMFLKPARLGSSYGAHPVRNAEDFEKAYTDAYSYDGRVLIEELVDVRYELECAFLESEGILLAPYGKITTDGTFYDYDKKYKSPSKACAKVDVDGIERRIKEAVIHYSEKLVRFLGLRYLSRIDFFVTPENEIYFNEINAFPGMTKSSLYPALTETMGLERGAFINALIESCCK